MNIIQALIEKIRGIATEVQDFGHPVETIVINKADDTEDRKEE